MVLLAVSAVSGLLWWVITPGPTSPGDQAGQTSQAPTGLYEFARHTQDQPKTCRGAATEKIAGYFAEHPCTHLTRTLYTTTLDNSEKVLTSVVTVVMPNEAAASRLERMATRTGTGNVQDLVSAGTTVPDGFPALDHDYGYASKQEGRKVVIGESSYFHNPERDDGRLQGVTKDALRLAPDTGLPG